MQLPNAYITIFHMDADKFLFFKAAHIRRYETYISFTFYIIFFPRSQKAPVFMQKMQESYNNPCPYRASTPTLLFSTFNLTIFYFYTQIVFSIIHICLK